MQTFAANTCGVGACTTPCAGATANVDTTHCATVFGVLDELDTGSIVVAGASTGVGTSTPAGMDALVGMGASTGVGTPAGMGAGTPAGMGAGALAGADADANPAKCLFNIRVKLVICAFSV